jgi:hypothetical protein
VTSATGAIQSTCDKAAGTTIVIGLFGQGCAAAGAAAARNTAATPMIGIIGIVAKS